MMIVQEATSKYREQVRLLTKTRPWPTRLQAACSIPCLNCIIVVGQHVEDKHQNETSLLAQLSSWTI
jgi:hypothetical protein